MTPLIFNQVEKDQVGKCKRGGEMLAKLGVPGLSWVSLDHAAGRVG